ncbi:hypothetical protein [Natrinema salaciae]|uniref:Uncharacterized protein n=1 Tax=Natrinema salaciae TaxID=1186196 RepID=A0A1H9JIS8_9EURY|nr:hypothetical protein [Natrinema salaciae]SEQ86658.1 hypothetical protein SAMN04489841_2573 [Natrinema salaciae]
MSAEQRGPTPARSTDERTRRPPLAPIPESDQRPSSRSHRPNADPEYDALPLSYRIERTQLRVRITALERALETSENRRQAVIDRYERLLADRDEVAESTAAAEEEPQTLLERLIGR